MTAGAEEKRPAAVIVPVFDAPPYDVLFIERASHLRRHAGQIAFPGGAVDPGDADHAAAALRELHEEVGIPPAAAQILGELPVIVQQRNVFAVSSYVAVVDATTPLVVDPNEAAAVHRVPLAEIMRRGAVHRGTHRDDEVTLETYILDYGGIHVWGLTGRILHAFVEAYHAVSSPLRAALEARLR